MYGFISVICLLISMVGAADSKSELLIVGYVIASGLFAIADTILAFKNKRD